MTARRPALRAAVARENVWAERRTSVDQLGTTYPGTTTWVQCAEVVRAW